MRRLIVNADDFGFTRDVNAGIVDAHRLGILTATTLMANGDAFDDAVRLAALHPSLDIGVHFVLIGGVSLLTGKPFPTSVPALVRAVALGQLRLEDELAAQAAKIVDAGLCPLHADTHKHTHLLAPVRRAVLAVCARFGIQWVRRPADLTAPYGAALSKAILTRVMHWMTPPMVGVRTTDHFAGFAITGRFDSHDLVKLFGHLPNGVTELMTHPGYCTDELQQAPTRLKESRQAELRALIAPETRKALSRHKIELVRYREL